MAAVTVLVAACGSPRLSRSAGGLEVDATSLSLPDAFVGYSSGAVVEIRNSARGPRRAQLSAFAPFSLGADSIEVGGGASERLEVRFFPEAEGPAAGALRLTVDGEALEIELAGLALAAPNCVASTPCRLSAFDPARGVCVEALLPDGVACQSGNSCLEASRCIAGECLGTTRSCDDFNRCTADACDAERGCVHLDISAQCPARANPCQLPSCDPAAGCGTRNAPDGTACGAADCDTAHVCLAGSCRAVAVPEGAACAPASPCQAKGVCRARVCERPAPVPLVAAWTYAPPSTRALYFNGLADAQGNLYWAECAPTLGCDLVSATSGGLVRYRVGLAGPFRQYFDRGQKGLLVLADGLVVSALSTDSLEARRAFDGSLAWTASLGPELPTGIDSILRAEFGPVVDDGQGHLLVSGHHYVYGCFGEVPGPDTLFSLQTATGALRWKSPLPGSLASLVADEAGNAYATASLSTDGGTFAGLISFGPSGAERWRAGEGASGYPLAVAGGRIALAAGSGSLFSAGDGGRLLPATAPEPLQPEAGVDPLLGLDAAYLFGRLSFTCCANCPCPMRIPELHLRSLFLTDASARWQTPLHWPSTPYLPDPRLSTPALASNGDVLFAQTPALSYPAPAQTPRLRAFTFAGAERFSCDLPGTGAYEAVDYGHAAALHAGRWVVAAKPECFVCDHVYDQDPPLELRAFDVPGYELGASGWVTSGGSNQRSGRPR